MGGGYSDFKKIDPKELWRPKTVNRKNHRFSDENTLSQLSDAADELALMGSDKHIEWTK